MENKHHLYELEWENIPYWQHLCTNFYSLCKGKTVLEIAPFDGWHSRAILSCEPTSLTAVEANPLCAANINIVAPGTIVVTDDIYHFYNNSFPVDVVTCCGLLYHLHSPVYLLELIANRSSPEYIIIDNISDTSQTFRSGYAVEPLNSMGNKYGEQSSKLVGLNCSLPLAVMDTAMKDLGYVQEYIDTDIKRFGMESKFGFMVTYRRA